MIAEVLSAFPTSSAAFFNWQYYGSDVDDVNVRTARAPTDLLYWRVPVLFLGVYAPNLFFQSCSIVFR